MENVAIIGGGFAGAAVAINLARFGRFPLRVSIYNRKHPVCRGLAYSAEADDLVLNVAAHKMSALLDQPDHFIGWLGGRVEFADQPTEALRHSFMPRRVYGNYLQELFYLAKTEAAKRGVLIEYHNADVTRVDAADGGFRVMANGAWRPAERLVLALGNLPPKPLPLPRDQRIIQDPWANWPAQLPDEGQDVLLVGCGLTMIDSFLLLRRTKWKGKIWVLGRRPGLPLPHDHGEAYPGPLINDAAPASLRQLFRLFIAHYRFAQARRISPAALVATFRPFTQRIWKNFTLAEKRRFLRHLKSRWNPARHRVAPFIQNELTGAIRSGRMQILPGAISDVTLTADSVRARILRQGQSVDLNVGAIVNCTGPSEDYCSTPLVANLIAQKIAVPDALNWGIQVADDYSVIEADGGSSARLFALGALLKGSLWETTAVPELRSQAFQIAQTITSRLQTESVTHCPASPRLQWQNLKA